MRGWTWCWASRRAALFSRRPWPTRWAPGFVPVRKPKKLPAECVRVTYDLEYGSDSLEMHKDAVEQAAAC